MCSSLHRLSFQTINETIEHVSQVCTEGNHPVRLEGRVTVGQFNRKTKNEAHKIRDVSDSQTYSVRWVCKHFGKKPLLKKTAEAANEVQRRRSHYTRGCTFFIYITWHRIQQCYKLRTSNLIHNHDIGPDIYARYPSARRHRSVKVRVGSVSARSDSSKQNVDSQTIDSIMGQYKSTVSPFAYTTIAHEYDMSLRSTDAVVKNENETFRCGWHTTTTTTCSCHSFVCFNLPCRHLFRVRKLNALPAFDAKLVHPRWCCSSETNDSTSSIQQLCDTYSQTAPQLQQTQAQRFKAAMAVFTSMAAVMAEFPPCQFFESVLWLSQIDGMLRDGTWKNNFSTGLSDNTNPPDVAYYEVVDDSHNDGDVIMQ